MTEQNAARIYKKVVQDNAQQEREKALSDPKAFISKAQAQGYTFTIEDLKTQLSKLSDEEVAGILNPGIGVRKHLFPK